MTEDEAKTKWCPFARPIRLDTGAWVHPQTVNAARPVNCIASACMAWRLTTPDGFWRITDDAGNVKYDTPDTNQAMTARGSGLTAMYTGTKQGDGFCGLAGAPQ